MEELSQLSGLSRRTIRYYIQIGLLEGPSGEGRGARYGRNHLDNLEKIRRLSEWGVSLEAVRNVLEMKDRPGGGEGPEPLGWKKALEGVREPMAWARVAQGVYMLAWPESGLKPEELREAADLAAAFLAGLSKPPNS
jgi:DNA-binding transcriptional MerR regulator